MRKATNERRRERRDAPESEHLSWWEQADRREPHLAEIVDASRSGIGLRVASTACPRHGDAIRLTHGPDNESRHARVVRVGPLDDEHVRLGCRWISARDRAADLPHPRKRLALARPVRRAI
ncbi:MAG: PilZ domain-containing protein [Phycisphaerales bacterium]